VYEEVVELSELMRMNWPVGVYRPWARIVGSPNSSDKHSSEEEVGPGGDVAQQDAWELVSRFYRSCPNKVFRDVSKYKKTIRTLRDDESALRFV
jgi:hypothetical protein